MDDKAEKVMRNLSSIIFDLRAENESLYDTIEMYSGRIDELRIEVSAREEVANEYKERIDNAIKYIKEHNLKEWVHDDYDITLYNALDQDECDNLLNILEGDNNE